MIAVEATRILNPYILYPECYDEETLKVSCGGKDPFNLPGLRYTRETAESMAISQLDGGAVIMAASGMCTGGRVRHHLKHNLWGRKNSVIFVGFAASGTLARRIIDGAERVKIFSEEIQVNASIHTIGGFSAHADQAELLNWHNKTGKTKRTFLVHGEEKSMNAFAKLLKETQVEIPELHQEYIL